MPTERPKRIELAANVPQDDGLFGPDSVTWRTFHEPVAGIGVLCAVRLQELLPRVARLLDQASSFKKNPDLRSRRTIEYAETITYGDVEAAENAGAALRRIHSQMKGVDLESGETYLADQPDLLEWVHATIVWGQVRAFDRWGPKLSPADRDQFVLEQRVAARLVGLDPETVAGTWRDLDDYMTRMQPRLALTMQAISLSLFGASRLIPLTPTWFIAQIAGLGALSIMTPDQRRLSGSSWSKLHDLAGYLLPALLLTLARKSTHYSEVLPLLRAQAMEHAFGRKKSKPARLTK